MPQQMPGLTTTEVRELLKSFGSYRPTRRAVELVASQTDATIEDGRATYYWKLRYAEDVIRTAVSAVKELRGEEAYIAFEAALTK